jgi:hypothetical protein
LKPSSSTAKSVSSDRFIRSIICLICFKSKGCLGYGLKRRSALVVFLGTAFKSNLAKGATFELGLLGPLGFEIAKKAKKLIK